MPEYTIPRTADFAVDADPTKDAWQGAPALAIDNFTWYTSGDKQATDVRLLWSETGVYALFTCEDKHIGASVTDLNGPVCKDSCVEFFATVDPERRPDYFNLEMNCCGVVHLGFGPDRHDRKLIYKELADRIEIATTVAGPPKNEQPEDDGWVLEVKLPFSVLEQFCDYTFGGQGTVWNANFYRCGGTDEQHSTTFPIEKDRPDFHLPQFFRPIQFG